MPEKNKELLIKVGDSTGSVSAVLMKPKDASRLLLFAHGAGADMHHRFMEAVSHKLSTLGVATLRYQFPYAQKRMRRPDPKPVLLATVRAAVAIANDIAGKLPLFVGGKSMGGRMTSLAASEAPLENVKGIVFFGFPLHPAGEPSDERAGHLSEVKLPMLFLQGTRDSLADLSLLKPVCKKLGRRSTLHIIEEADHAFHVPKRTGKSDDDVLHELAKTFADWSSGIA